MTQLEDGRVSGDGKHQNTDMHKHTYTHNTHPRVLERVKEKHPFRKKQLDGYRVMQFLAVKWNG